MGGALPRPGASILGVLVLSAVILATPAGRRPFWSSDEARFALLAQDALDHGRWLVAELRGRHYLNKPQLFFWAVAVASVPFGRVTEVSAAIPALVSSVAGVAGVIAVGRLLWGWQAGAVAGLILATTPLYFELSHQVLPDGMLNAWLVWALYWLLRGQRAGWSLTPVLAFYACFTGALLSKGPQALAALAAAGVALGFTEGRGAGLVAAVSRCRTAPRRALDGDPVAAHRHLRELSFSIHAAGVSGARAPGRRVPDRPARRPRAAGAESRVARGRRVRRRRRRGQCALAPDAPRRERRPRAPSGGGMGAGRDRRPGARGLRRAGAGRAARGAHHRGRRARARHGGHPPRRGDHVPDPLHPCLRRATAHGRSRRERCAGRDGGRLSWPPAEL